MMGPFGRAISKYGVALSLVTILIAFPGCGGGDKKKSETASSSTTESTKSKPASGGSTKSAAGKEEEGDGRRNVGGVPFDVYFDNPLAEASDQRPVGGRGGTTGTVGTEVAMNSEGNATTPPATAATPEPEPAVASADGPKWSELISAQ